MKIAVVSDSHKALDKLNFALEKLKEFELDLIVHAGDFVSEDALIKLSNFGTPYYAVFGNNDTDLHHLEDLYSVKKEPFIFEHNGLKIKLMHLPFFLQDDGSELTIFGHTHQPFAQGSKRRLVVNAGEICAREQALIQCAVVEKTADGWVVTELRSDGVSWSAKEEWF